MADWDTQQAGAAPSRESHTAMELNRLNQSAEELGKTVHIIEERLQNVLRPPAPTTQEAAAKEKEQMVPLADAIRQTRQKVVRSMESLMDILRRLEL